MIQILLMLCLYAHAKPALKYEMTSAWEKPPRLALLEVQTALQAQGFTSLDRHNAGRMTWIAVDQVYVTPSFDKAVFVKFGLQLVNKSDDVIKTRKGFVFHRTSRDGDAIALYFLNFSETEAHSLVTSLPLAEQKAAWFVRNLFPVAHAETVGQTTSTASTRRGFVPTPVLTVGTATATCMIHETEAVKHAAIETWNSAKDFLSDPVAYWESVEKKFDDFKEMLANFNKELAETMEAISQIDTETAFIIGCTMAGHIHFASLLAIGGVGVVKGAANFAKLISQLKIARSALLNIARLKKLKKVSESEVADLVKGVLNCATP